MAKKKDEWISKLKKGALTEQAKRAGMTVAEFCSQPKEKLSPLARKRCRVRETLRRLAKRKKR